MSASAAQKKYARLNLILGLMLLIAGLVGFSIGWRQANTEFLLSLTFHGVADSPRTPFEISYDEIKRILRQLRKYGFEALPPEDLKAWWEGSKGGGRKFLITFDDGLVSSGEAMKKLWQEEKIKSAIFLITDQVGSAAYLDWPAIAGLAEMGATIGLHGKRHEEVPKLMASGVNLGDELLVAAGQIARATGRMPTLYAYPFGVSNEEAGRAVASLGFSFAFTVDPKSITRRDSPMFLPRLMYLKGIEKTGEISMEDFLPPREIRDSGLTLTLAFLVMIWSFGLLFRFSSSSRLMAKAG